MSTNQSTKRGYYRGKALKITRKEYSKCTANDIADIIMYTIFIIGILKCLLYMWNYEV